MFILNETIRNVYFHVPMWFTMITLMGISSIYSFLCLQNESLRHDLIAHGSTRVGMLFAILGMITGSLWARFTWGTWWTLDTKLNGVAISFLIYMAYFILRNSIPDDKKRARISAVYNLFSFVMMIVFIMILPRMTSSLHPGNGGNPAFGKYDLDNTMRTVFYPAVIGWILIGIWILNLFIRKEKLTYYAQYHEEIQ
jgi:heme exporter protein C